MVWSTLLERTALEAEARESEPTDTGGIPQQSGELALIVQWYPGTTLNEINKLIAYHTLKNSNYNRTQTARLLGISVRALFNWMRELQQEGIPVERSKYAKKTR